MVDRIPIKQKGSQSNSRRTCRPTYNYNLQYSRVKYQVCAKMFADTFGVSSRTIGDWISTSTGDNSPTKAIAPEAVLIKAKPAKVPHNKVPQECKEFLTRFIRSLATVDSHYCRAKHRDRKFLEPGTTLQNLYREHRKQITTAEIHCVSYPLFDKAMKDCNINITIFLQKKEQCDKCLSAKEGYIIRVYLFY